MKNQALARRARAAPKRALSQLWPGRSGAGLYLAGAVALTAALGASALINRRLAKKAERDNPPLGRFVTVRGVRLHIVERGEGEPLVLLHGNGTMIEDLEISGLIERAAARHRVIAIDRPGFGHSSRPWGTVWNDEAQAEVISQALDQIGVARAVVLGHSWGCTVATALALNHPEQVSALVLVSGYYYPSVRADAAASALMNFPGVGDVIRYAISPWLARATWPLLLRKLFGPAPTPADFSAFPKEMTFRPSQLGASLADSALMVPDAAMRSLRYGELKGPVVLIAGEEDRVVDIDAQSGRLHRAVPQSTLRRVAGAGHMVHHSATGDVLAAIEEASTQAAKQAPVAHARKAAF